MKGSVKLGHEHDVVDLVVVVVVVIVVMSGTAITYYTRARVQETPATLFGNKVHILCLIKANRAVLDNEMLAYATNGALVEDAGENVLGGEDLGHAGQRSGEGCCWCVVWEGEAACRLRRLGCIGCHFFFFYGVSSVSKVREGGFVGMFVVIATVKIAGRLALELLASCPGGGVQVVMGK